MKYPLFALAIAGLMLGGCAVKPRCELQDGREICAGMKDAYRGSVAGGGNKDNVLAPVESRDPKDPAAPLNLQAGRHQLAGPVFMPPKPYRFWVAPWTDANGLLHSGEQVFFTTPGKWTYGPMGKSGSLGDLMAPIRPQDLGFRPLVVTPEELKERKNKRTTRGDARRNGVTLPDREISNMGSTSSRYGEPVGAK